MNLQEIRRFQSTVLMGFLGSEGSLAEHLDGLDQEGLSVVVDLLSGAPLSADALRDPNRLTATRASELIRSHVSNSTIDRWVSCLPNLSDTDFKKYTCAISKSIGGERFALALIRLHILRETIGRLIACGDASLLLSVFKEAESSPTVAASVVFDFISATRDYSSDRSVLSAFFEGFTVDTTINGIGIKWSASPMLKALSVAEKLAMVRMYEDFIRGFLMTKLVVGDPDIGEWQRLYDQKFKLLLNVQSGMFSPNSEFEYGVECQGLEQSE